MGGWSAAKRAFALVGVILALAVPALAGVVAGETLQRKAPAATGAVGVLDASCGVRYGSAEPFLAWWMAAPSVRNSQPVSMSRALCVWSGANSRSFLLWPEAGLAIDPRSGEQHRAEGLAQALANLSDLKPITRPENLPDDQEIARRHARLPGPFDHLAYQNHAVALVYGRALGSLPASSGADAARTVRILMKVASWIGRVEIRDPYVVVHWPAAPQTEIRLPVVGETLIAALNPAVPRPAAEPSARGSHITEWDIAIPLPIGVVAVVNGKTAAYHSPLTPPNDLPDSDRIRMRWTPPVPVYGQDPRALFRFLEWSLAQEPLRFPRPAIPAEIGGNLLVEPVK